MLFCPLKPAPAYLSCGAPLGMGLDTQPLLNSVPPLLEAPLGALVMWAVLGAGLPLLFVTSSSPRLLFKLGGSWAHCDSAVPVVASHFSHCL